MPAPPVNLVDDAYDVVEGTSQSYGARNGLLFNDDGGLTVTKVVIGGVEYGVGGLINTPLGGALLVRADGTFDYTAPVRDHSDTISDTENFQYYVKDSVGLERGPASVTINITDTVPVAVDDNYAEAEFDPARNLRGNVLDNDRPSEDTPTQVATVKTANGGEQAVNGQTMITTDEGGTVWIKPDGSFEYLRPPYFAGQDSFQYQLVDSDGSLSDWATVTFNVPAPPPVVIDDLFTAVEGVTTTNLGDVLLNDSLGAKVGTVLDVTTHQEVAVTTNGVTVATSLGGSVTIYQDGHFDYTAPVRGNAGTDVDSFQYKAADINGQLSSTSATVSISIIDAAQVAPTVEHLVSGGSNASDLNGTAGVDVFQWSLSDLGGNNAPVHNTVTQFSVDEGDKLDLRDLLQDGNDFLFDTSHLAVTTDGQNTTIIVTPVNANAPDLNILIEGVDLTGGFQGQDAINHMITNGTLIDDHK